MLDTLDKYKQQQFDNGEPEWPSQTQAAQEAQDRVRGLFSGGIDKVPFNVSPWSQDPAQDKAIYANMAFLSHAYNKPAQEIADRADFYRNDYARQFFGQPGGVDEKTFYGLASKQIERQKQVEDTALEGTKAALRGDDLIASLQAWQLKNGKDRMPDSTEFTKGFLAGHEWAGDHLPVADMLLKQLESNAGMTKQDGAERPAPAGQESAAQFEKSLEYLAEMPPRQRKQMYAVLGAKAEAAGYDQKGFWAQMLAFAGKQIAHVGDRASTFAADVAGGGIVDGDAMGGFHRPVSSEELQRYDAASTQRGKRGVIYDELADIVSGKIDPVKPVVGWLPDNVETGLIKAPGAVAPYIMASAGLGPLGAGGVFVADFAEGNRRDLVRSGMDDHEARLIGYTAAPIQAASESLANMVGLGKFPAVQKVLGLINKPITSGQGVLGRYLLNAATNTAAQVGQEHFQDSVVVPVVQDLVAAFDKDVSGGQMGHIFENIKKANPELMFTIAPMSLVFGGFMTSAQVHLSREMTSSQDLLEATGFSAAQANAIRAEGSQDAQISKARELWGQRQGTPQSMEDAAKSVAERMRMLQTDHVAAQQDLERRGILPRMLHAEQDRWRLTFNDGSVADFNSHQEADAARWQWASDQLGKVHLATREALAQMEKNAAVGREFAVEFKPDALTAQQVVDSGRASGEQMQRRVQQGAAAGESAAEPVSELETFENAQALSRSMGGGNDLSSQFILGSSANEFKDGVLRTTIRLYEGAHVLTLVEEKLEGDAKQIVASKPGREWMLQSLRNYEQQSGDTILRNVADDQLTNDDLVEAWSSLGQAYLVGKSKKGSAIGKGGARRIFSDVLKAGMGGAMNSETQFFNAVWRRAAKLGKLKREGKLGEDLAAELEHQLGIDSQAKHEAEAAKEAEAIANEARNVGGASYSEENPGPNGETFAIQRGDFSARMAAAFSPFQRSPELRMSIGMVAKARLARAAADKLASFGPDKQYVTKGLQSLLEEKGWIENRADELMQEWLDGLTPAARQDYEAGIQSIEDHPLIQEMRGQGIKIMRRATAIAKGLNIVDGKETGDYNGMPALPASLMAKPGNGMMPDKAAQAIHDAAPGLLKNAHTDTLWDALASVIRSVEARNTAFREVNAKVRQARRDAMSKAKSEAPSSAAYNQEQRKKMKALVQVLDAILSAAPPEVRAKVGDYAKILDLDTDAKMMNFIGGRIAKLNTELEKYLKKEGIEQVQALLKKGAPKSEAGKKAKGKDADLHHLFAAAEKASKMDATAVAGELARLDSLIAGDTLTPEQEVLATTERGLVELLGDLYPRTKATGKTGKNGQPLFTTIYDGADSGRIFSAIDTLRDIYDGAWLKWKLAEIERKERRAGARHEFITDTGKDGVKAERDAAEKAAATFVGKIKSGFLSLSSFHEVLNYAFGEKSNRVKSLVDAERDASGQYEDANQSLADEVESLFKDIAGSVVAGERLRYNLAQRTIKTAKGDLSQMEAIQALLMWRQEDGQRHMEGTRNENGEVTSKWSYDQAWINEITAALTPEAKRVMSWIMQKYGAEWATLNPFYRARYGVNMPAHDNYAPITVTPVQPKAGEVADPVTGTAMSSGSVLSPGSLRTRSRSAIAEPEFRDALQTYILHARQLEYWKAYYDLATEANAILGNREVLNAVHAKGGKEAANALRQWVDAIAQGGFKDASMRLDLMRGLSRVQGRAAGVALLGRMSAILSQSTQIMAAAVQIPVASYLKRLAKLTTGNLGWGDAINSDFIQRRYKSAPPIVRQAMDSLASAKPNQVQRLTRFFGNAISASDAFFTSGTYAILLDYHREQGGKLGLKGAELDAYAHSEAERATEQVAQPTRLATRSLAELTNTSPLAKLGWSFASEARQKVALAAWATANISANPARAVKALALATVVGGLFNQILKNLLREAKGDDDEKMWSADRLLYATFIAPLVSAIPFGSAIAGDSNMLSSVQRSLTSLNDGKLDWGDVDTILSAAGIISPWEAETFAALAQLSHAGRDASKIIGNSME